MNIMDTNGSRCSLISSNNSQPGTNNIEALIRTNEIDGVDFPKLTQNHLLYIKSNSECFVGNKLCRKTLKKFMYISHIEEIHRTMFRMYIMPIKLYKKENF